tara:strand:- start:187 stop:654 length:468 start_codon:yes stop_codon:yes gene_type:complete
VKLILALCLSLFALTSQAVIDGHKYPFDNAVDEERFEVLAEELRCPKCQNQNLADSNAPVASDLRDKVYELMIQGQTDDQIVGYLVARYGDFVRYNPPVQKNTFFLWFGPGVMVLIALIIIISLTRGGKKSQPLSEEENVKLAELKAARSEKQES